MKKTIITIMLASLTWGASSCENFLDVNDNPNNLQSVGVEFLLPGSQIGTAFVMGNTIQIVTSLWMQQIAGTGTQTDQFDRYNVTPNDFNNEWNSLYANLLDDLRQVETQGQEEGNFIHAGMAQVLQAYVWAVTTDIWGDIPFTQALNFDEFAQPDYEQQQAVYQQIHALLDAGIANLGRTNVIAASSGDLIYSGNTDKWIRAANSLKLKLYVQSRNSDAAAATAGINALIEGNRFIQSNADNFVVRFVASAGSQNPIYQYNHLTRPNDQLISTRFYDSLRVLNDPRLPYLVTQAGTNYVTYDNGVHTQVPFVAANRSRWGAYVVGIGTLNPNGTITGAGNAPIRLITKSMVNFWLAEAALTLGTTGNANTYFGQAIQDHLDDVGTFVQAPATYTTAGTAYVESRVAAFNARTSVPAKLNLLIRDKWVTTSGIAYEAYNDYRRTGFPRLALAQNAQPGVTRIPTRWPYVQTEIQANNENVPIQDYPSGIQVPVWWMPQ